MNVTSEVALPIPVIIFCSGESTSKHSDKVLNERSAEATAPDSRSPRDLTALW